MSTAKDVEVKLGVEVDTRGFGRFLEALCGVFPPPPLDPDVARWEDDGGPPAPDPINYTHTIRTDTGPWMMTTTTAYDGGEGWERLPDLEPFEADAVKSWYARPDPGKKWAAETIYVEDLEAADHAEGLRVTGLRWSTARSLTFEEHVDYLERELRRDEIVRRAYAARRRYCVRQGHHLRSASPHCCRSCRVSLGLDGLGAPDG